jgi:hypothetical protein
VQIFFNAGGDVHMQGGKYGNALQAASLLGGHNELVHILLNAGADVNMQGRMFHNQIISCHQDVVKILFDAGANVWGEGDNALVNKKRHLNVV